MSYYEINNQHSNLPIVTIRGLIGDDWWGVSEDSFVYDMDSLGAVDEIEVHISSQGGDVDTGIAIYNYLKNHRAKITTKVYSQAASIASIIFLAGDKRVMLEGTTIFVHEPLMNVQGYAADLFKSGDYLETIKGNLLDIYEDRTGQTRTSLVKLMRDETLMDSNESVRRGFATETAINSDIVLNNNSQLLTKEELAASLMNTIQERRMSKEQDLKIKAVEDQIATMQTTIEAVASKLGVEGVVATPAVVTPVVVTPVVDNSTMSAADLQLLADAKQIVADNELKTSDAAVLAERTENVTNILTGTSMESMIPKIVACDMDLDAVRMMALSSVVPTPTISNFGANLGVVAGNEEQGISDMKDAFAKASGRRK